MRILGLTWLGVRTEHYPQTVDLFRDVLNLDLSHEERDFANFLLPDGSKVEVFGPASEFNHHFTTGPVAGFLVEDVHAAVEELRAADVEIVQEPGANYWAHFRGPDGRIYELTADPDQLSREREG
jgi:catechol 2,3-dioxygenase-like lactoylglutathione lyase family enzyme